jgi:hypothetical protein
VKLTPALIRQGHDIHLWLDTRSDTACGSKIGSCSTEASRVTCDRCREGKRADDVATGPYGPYKRPPQYCDDDGQWELL